MLDERSKYLRQLCLRAFKAARKGHIGSSFSLIEILRVLYDDVAKYKPEEPKWKERDRIILSKGHGGLALFALLADKGYFPIEELDKFCQPDGILGGHPSHHVPGVECDTGALGHGLGIGVGMAIAAKIEKRNSHIFVIMGDGEIQEGSVWESAMCAAKHKLDNLTVIIDYNKIQSAGFVDDICPLEPLKQKWVTFGFMTWDCDGHDVASIQQTLKHDFFAKREQKPMCIIAHTVKGKGCSFAENNPAVHYYSKLDDEMIEKLEAELA
jgi:transketolase